jgi:hypothetical protein
MNLISISYWLTVGTSNDAKDYFLSPDADSSSAWGQHRPQAA